MKLFLGIDPGINGGISVLNEDGSIRELHKIPTFEIEKKTAVKSKKAPRTQKQIDFRELFNILEPIYKGNDVMAYVEEITHLFGLPSSSNFRLGYACGVVHAALQTFGDFYLVKARDWQGTIWTEDDKIFKPSKRVDPKPTSKNAAMRLYPDEAFAPGRARAFQDGPAEATLIARHGLIIEGYL